MNGRLIIAAVLLAGQPYLIGQTPPAQAQSTQAQSTQAQPTQQAKPSAAALKQARHRFNLAATRAAANFRSADAIEGNLRAQGSTLHPQINALRFRVETALDDAQQGLKDGDLSTANEETTRAEQMLDKFAKLLGGY